MVIRTAISVVLAILLLSPGAIAQDLWPTKKWPTAEPKDVGF